MRELDAGRTLYTLLRSYRLLFRVRDRNDFAVHRLLNRVAAFATSFKQDPPLLNEYRDDFLGRPCLLLRSLHLQAKHTIPKNSESSLGAGLYHIKEPTKGSIGGRVRIFTSRCYPVINAPSPFTCCSFTGCAYTPVYTDTHHQ